MAARPAPRAPPPRPPPHGAAPLGTGPDRLGSAPPSRPRGRRPHKPLALLLGRVGSLPPARHRALAFCRRVGCRGRPRKPARDAGQGCPHTRQGQDVLPLSSRCIRLLLRHVMVSYHPPQRSVPSRRTPRCHTPPHFSRGPLSTRIATTPDSSMGSSSLGRMERPRFSGAVPAGGWRLRCCFGF